MTISSKSVIPEKDRISLYGIEEADWTVISAKDDFEVGDEAVYVEVNSLLPARPEFEFLRKRCWSDRRGGFVLKTMKMGGVYSQGILFRLDAFDDATNERLSKSKPLDDVTDLLRIKPIQDDVPLERRPKSKWERFWDAFLWKLFKKRRKTSSSSFPSHLIPKTDETQVQSLSYVYDAWKGKPCYSTVKIDGMSVTILLWKGKFIVASRNTTLYESTLRVAAKKLKPSKYESLKGDPWLAVVAKYDVPSKLLKSGTKAFAINAEVAGPGIQKNRLGLDDIDAFVFNAYDLEKKRYFGWDKIVEVASSYGLKTVPFLEKKTFDFESIDDLRAYAEGSYPNGHPREGVVIRLLNEDGYVPPPSNKMANQASFKVINEKFRLKVEQD